MAVGKYSPTVNAAYANDQTWWLDNGDFHDKDGYDSYGYNKNGLDRAGNSEEDYLLDGAWIDDEFYYELYVDVGSEWSIDQNGFPRKR